VSTKRLTSPDSTPRQASWLIRAIALAYAVFLTWLTLAPNPWWLFGVDTRGVERAVDSTLGDWIQHGMAYGLLAVLFALARWPGPVGLWLAAVMAHALLTEWLQGFVPDRTSDWTDAVANGAGVACGWLIVMALSRIMRGRRSIGRGRKPAASVDRESPAQAAVGPAGPRP
jgi:VanZ family protein